MEIWGLCGQCERWFFCEGWFDRDVPAPTCPHCGGEPSAIENRRLVDDMDSYVRVTTSSSAVLEVTLPAEVWLG